MCDVCAGPSSFSDFGNPLDSIKNYAQVPQIELVRARARNTINLGAVRCRHNNNDGIRARTGAAKLDWYRVFCSCTFVYRTECERYSVRVPMDDRIRKKEDTTKKCSKRYFRPQFFLNKYFTVFWIENDILKAVWGVRTPLRTHMRRHLCTQTPIFSTSYFVLKFLVKWKRKMRHRDEEQNEIGLQSATTTQRLR